jgi:DNA-directed RNA polymerase subunit M/transcription elongation factor TFIIS
MSKIHQIISKYIHKQVNVEILERYIEQYSPKDNKEEYVYEIVGMLLLDDHITSQTIKDVVRGMYNNTVLWEHPVYNDYRDKQEEEDMFITEPFKIEEGVLQCNKCESKRTFSFQRQTRSADEGATTFAQCAECGSKWRMNN